MSFDLASLTRAVQLHGEVVRIVVASAEGSTPRETGTAMLVWKDGQDGTIGGGTLEFQATEQARTMLMEGQISRLERVPLGPSLGQCCGGAVTLLSEAFDVTSVQSIATKEVFSRPTGETQDAPFAISRLLAKARSQGIPSAPSFVEGWMVEPVVSNPTPLWIYGAGHVGRALVNVITDLPDFVITWVDTSADRFPTTQPSGVTILPAARPEMALRHAPANAHHLILTFSHALDLELCHTALTHDFASVGLIGSATKWARFRSRLRALGHNDTEINQITCPIGEPALGKHPQQIAIGVAGALIKQVAIKKTNREMSDDRKSERKEARAVNS